MSPSCCWRWTSPGQRGILIVAAGCAALTVLSYVITHGHDPASGPFLRGLISLVAIAITGALAARHQGTIEALREHANLLDLTHDTIFVRNHDDVITYWNRAATELYGWRREQAVGRKAAELLQTEFPVPFDDDHGRARRAPDAGRASWCTPRATAGASTVASRWALQRDGRGRPAAILETNNDITERSARSRTACTAPSSELAHVARVATLGELTASIAHEVNQPLAAVVTNGEACLRWLDARRSRPRPGAQLGRAHDQERPARQRGGAPPARPVAQGRSQPTLPLSLVDVVNDVALLVGRELLSPSRDARRERDRPTCRWCSGDRVQLQQVVINLLMNGMQAMDGVADRPRRLAVDVGAATEGAAVRSS